MTGQKCINIIMSTQPFFKIIKIILRRPFEITVLERTLKRQKCRREYRLYEDVFAR